MYRKKKRAIQGLSSGKEEENSQGNLRLQSVRQRCAGSKIKCFKDSDRCQQLLTGIAIM